MIHLFGSIVTEPGISSSNRGAGIGHQSFMQKLLTDLGEQHTTVSAEAIRWSIRRYWELIGIPVNRSWDEEESTPVWHDKDHLDKDLRIDDDLLGYMDTISVQEGDTEEPEEEDENGKKKPRKKKKGGAKTRRSPLMINRAISLAPFRHDMTFGSRSGKDKDRTSRHDAEIHYTRYRYHFGITPTKLQKPERMKYLLAAIRNLSEVGGNQARFYYDFSPESVVFRISHQPVSGISNIFEENEEKGVLVSRLIQKMEVGDIPPAEVYIGGSVLRTDRKLKAFLETHPVSGHDLGISKIFEIVTRDILAKIMEASK